MLNIVKNVDITVGVRIGLQIIGTGPYMCVCVYVSVYRVYSWLLRHVTKPSSIWAQVEASPPLQSLRKWMGIFHACCHQQLSPPAVGVKGSP